MYIKNVDKFKLKAINGCKYVNKHNKNTDMIDSINKIISTYK